MLVNLPPTLIMNYIFLGQKSSIDFLPRFSPFYPDRLTSESYNNPLKVIPEGSMVEYLPVGSKEGPQTIIGKKKNSSPKFLNHNPSPLCTGKLKKMYRILTFWALFSFLQGFSQARTKKAVNPCKNENNFKSVGILCIFFNFPVFIF